MEDVCAKNIRHYFAENRSRLATCNDKFSTTCQPCALPDSAFSVGIGHSSRPFLNFSTQQIRYRFISRQRTAAHSTERSRVVGDRNPTCQSRAEGLMHGTNAWPKGNTLLWTGSVPCSSIEFLQI